MTLDQTIHHLQAVTSSIQMQIASLPADKASAAMNIVRKLDEVIKEVQALTR